ncbi:MAG: hypothetical protein U9O20_04260 [Patescibacteria group bacterium]|nr:hypothetical protein [Patescibacteria group bacterium]
MEKGPQIRFVGGASTEKKRQIKKEIERALYDHYPTISKEDLEIIKKEERPKTEMELGLFDYANKESNILMERAGLPSYDIPAENFHMLSPNSIMKPSEEIV